MNPEERRARRAAYMREYRRLYPEKVRASEASCREKRKAAQALLARAWYEKNMQLCKERARKHFEENREKHYHHTKQWRLLNREKELEIYRAWRRNNKDKSVAHVQKRNAAKLKATPIWANEFFIGEAYHLAKVRAKATGVAWHVDHIVPLRSKLVCGLHVEHNLRVIPAFENMTKGNRFWPDMP